ncbi:MAG: sulfite exporter TauE/SafE family protein [Pseudomonadota bacterium]
MTDPIFYFVLFALISSAFIKGSLGLGFSTICLAILANVLELKTAISIVVIPSLISNVMVMIEAGNFRVSLRTFAWMLLMAVPGMLVGLQILRQADNSLSLTILSGVLVIYGCWGLLNRHFRIDERLIPRLNPVIGFFTGTVNGATGSQIFPIMPYLLSLNISKDVLVQTINMSFSLSSLIMLSALYYMNALDTASLFTYSLGIVPVMAGVWLGGKVRRRLSEQRFRQAVMVLIIVLGVLLLFR